MRFFSKEFIEKCQFQAKDIYDQIDRELRICSYLLTIPKERFQFGVLLKIFRRPLPQNTYGGMLISYQVRSITFSLLLS